MSNQLKKHQEFEESQIDQEPKFHDFQEIHNQSAKLEELFFFARIAIFSLITVLFAFVLLSLNLSPLWAFLFSSLLSFGVTFFLSKTIKTFLS
ncbi:DUF3270 domain-containing protein [Streptococcus catagoni]|uniref:DUF3270 domain-containing protein n=1 Tax=Streptococcus catagoni TaxID=2654874 RepID=UPI00140A6223|nr:DUF3270 domain-containing protein [Streptococcus catagoni]